MRTFFKNIVVTVVLVLSLFSFETKGQIGSVYPVDLNVMLTPPYGTCLTDLSNSNRFVIQALLRDMNHGNNYEMLIQMRVKSLSSMNTVFLSYSNKFSIGMGKPAVVLGAGNTPVSISNFFESGNVLIGQNILNDNCLPEGAYLFCFQAFDAKAYYAKQRIPISKEFTVTAFLENGATPILISPANNDSLSCQMPNVIFQWQQPYITSGINSYTLQVAEANSPFDGPQIIENGGNLLIEKRGLMMPICDIPVTEANFKENHTYYWRVVMCDKDGKARASYPNKGASPVYKFVYCGTPQEPEPEDAWVPQIPMAKSIKKSLDRLRIDTVLSDESSCSAYWFQDPVDVREKYDGVVIEVKKKNQDTWTPFLTESKVATDTLVALSSLAYKETYMARGQYFLYEDGEKVYAPYSDTIEFKIPHPADTLECGNAAPELTDCTNAGERAELEIGDEFNANGTTVSIDTITSQTISGSSVIISGEGHLPFPILSKFGLKVSFDNIEINCADELKKGQVISVYDEKTAAMIDLNNILGKGAAGNDLKQEDASLTEVGPDDDLSGFKSGDLIVEDGKVSLIVGNGNVVQVGTVIDLSNSDAYNDNGALNDEDIYVKFSNPDHENIAFDDDPTGMIRRAATLSRNYVSFGEEYIIPWVATNPGRIFQLTAMPSKDLSKSGFTDVKFVLPASGTHVVLDAVENGDGSYSVSIPGMKVDVQNQVYAIARKGEGSPYENVGKLNLCCYSYKSKKVVIVPLLEGLSVNTDEVKKDLDRVYAKLGYTFEVELDDDAAHREGLSTTIGLETDFLSDFSEEMKEFIFNYEINIGDAYDKDAAYLFLLDKPTGKYKDAAGIMPQRQQYGFIFMQGAVSITTDLTHTMAHELGHGLFGLDHIFSGAYGIKKGATYNLMDYTEKTPNDALSYHEWTQINLPLPNWSALSRAEEDMNRKGKERQEKAWETAWQIYEEEKLKGRNIVYYTLRNTLKTVNENDGLGTRKEDLSLNYISGQIKFQNNLVQNIWFDNLLNNRMVDNKVEFTQSSSLYTFESELELGDFILYEAGDGSVQFCRIPSASIAGIDKKGEALSNHVKENWQNCVAPTSTEQEDEQQIKSTLNALAQQFRSTQYVEYSANGIAYRLNKNGELEKSTLSNEDINKGLFSGVDEIYRFEKNGTGIFQLSAYGINQSLTNVQGKAVDKEALAKYIKELANEFFVENKVSSPEQKPTQSLDSNAFPDGDKVEIDKNAFFTKIISEAGGIGITFLKTSEVEPQVYYKDANKLPGDSRKNSIIHGPAFFTGVTEGVGQELTDITSMCSMIYGVIVDKEERQKTIDGFKTLKDQVADDPKTLFPLLGDVVLASVTSSTSGDFKEMMDENTDDGRSGHLKTRTVAGTTITVVETAVGGGVTMLPSISKKLAQKIRLQKWLKKINLPDGVDTKAFTKTLDNLEDGGEAFLKDFENASSEVIREFVKDPDLVIQWNFIKGHHPIIAKDPESLKALKSIRGNKMAESLGFDDDFLKKISGTEGLAYKDLINSCDNFSKAVVNKIFTIDEAGFKKVLGNLMDGVDGSTSSRIKIKEIGAEWTFRHLGEHPEMYREKHLQFECVEHVGENGDKIRYVDMKTVEKTTDATGKTTEKTIFYEFKSVKNIPPEHFFDQFGKDLLNNNVDELSQLKWIFDGKKVTQTQLTEKMKTAIKEWDIPNEVLKKWNIDVKKDPNAITDFKTDLLNIFKAE